MDSVETKVRHRWTLMFWAAALFNFAIGIPVWMVTAWTYQIAFREAATPGAIRHWSDFGFAVTLIGIGYVIVAVDVTRNRGIVWLGIFAKLFDVIVLSWRAWTGIAHPIVLLPAGIDGFFVLLFVGFLNSGIGREYGIPNFPRRFSIAHWLHDTLYGVMKLERRIDPFFRPAFDRAFREPIACLTQALLNLFRTNEMLGLAEEKCLPEEEALMARITSDMSAYMRDHYKPGNFERGGNTKTYGVVRAEFAVLDGLPEGLRHGLFTHPQTFKAYVRFGGPGPASPPDIDDAGILSIGVKLMGVKGPKLMEDEKETQDFTGISAPTFTTPDARENAKLQRAIRRGLPLFYFIGLRDPHLFDVVMQGLWSRTQSSPLETDYWGCVPYLLGTGQAMQYSFRPRHPRESKVPNLPGRPPDNYLREAMAATLRETEMIFDFYIQVQTDSFRMPIEHAGVRWPEKLSNPIRAATLTIPAQTFDYPDQLAFAHKLSINPWHCLEEHRPLGNQNRVRRHVYYTLSQLRQQANGTPHVEPNGSESFGGRQTRHDHEST